VKHLRRNEPQVRLARADLLDTIDDIVKKART